MQSAFHKISRVRGLLGYTKWYLSEDCLLSAKLNMYAVEYQRFYLRDLESIVVWRSRWWYLRLVLPGLILAVMAASWHWINEDSGALFVGVLLSSVALVWLVAELILGPTAKSRIRTVGGTVELPLVARTRFSRKVMDKIETAVRIARSTEQSSAAKGEASIASPATYPASMPETNAT